MLDREEQRKLQELIGLWAKWRFWIISVIALLFFGLVGYAYQQFQVDERFAYSNQKYYQFKQLLQEPDTDVEALQTALSQLDDNLLFPDHYALMLMHAAVAAFSQEQYIIADEYASEAFATTNDETMRSLIVLQRARILARLGKYKQAIATLDDNWPTPIGLQALFLEASGDIYTVKGDYVIAKQNYVEAVRASQQHSPEFSEMIRGKYGALALVEGKFISFDHPPAQETQNDASVGDQSDEPLLEVENTNSEQ